jgi:hypothetical protein
VTGCPTRKPEYMARAMAIRAIEARRRVGGGLRDLVAYRCTICLAYHVGREVRS